MRTDFLSSSRLVRCAWVLAVTFVLAPAAALFAAPGQVQFATTAVTGLPMYFPSVGFDFSAWSNIHYDHTAGLLSADGTLTFLTKPDGSNLPIKGNQQQTGNYGPATFGRAAIRINVNNQGVLAPQAAHDACGDGTHEDFCVNGYVTDATGTVVLVSGASDANGNPLPVPGALLRGTVMSFGSTRSKPFLFSLSTFKSCTATDGDPSCYLFDAFEFVIQLDGGLLKNDIDYPGGIIAVEVASIRADALGNIGQTHCDTACEPVTTFSGFFNTDFTGYNIDGSAAPTDPIGFATDLCDGKISGSVRDSFGNPLDGVDVSLSGGFLGTTLKMPSALNGTYSFPGLCAVSGYTVFADTPTNYTFVSATNSGSVTVSFGTRPDGSMGDVATPSSVDFTFQSVGSVSLNYLTFGQGAWGAKPRGQNAAYYLATYYSVPYGTGPVIIGGTKTVQMTGPTAIQNFLPQGGRPQPLDGNYVDPVVLKGHRKPHNKLGSLAGETLALRLNVDFSTAGLTRPGLGALHIASGPLATYTVSQVLAWANAMLGGGLTPAAIGLKSYDALEDVVERINRNYDAGTIDRGYLKP